MTWRPHFMLASALSSPLEPAMIAIDNGNSQWR